MMSAKREHFSSRFAVIAAVAGSAVGLGNIWKFPYVLGNNGGSAFMLVYILFVVVLGLPLMMSEIVIGRRAQTNSFRAFKKIAPTFRWAFLGIIPSLAAFFILSYYTTVAGWTLEYLYQQVGHWSICINLLSMAMALPLLVKFLEILMFFKTQCYFLLCGKFVSLV